MNASLHAGEAVAGKVTRQLEKPPFVQIEITTKCNFECFYCAGRHMKQENMSWEQFNEILRKLAPGSHTVSLQGEGEPTAHPQFWPMIDRLAALGHEPYTITNASLINATQAALKFKTLGVSLDTLDEAEAHRIGRYKLLNVVRRIRELIEAMGAARVIVHTVAYGQDIEPVSQFVRALGAKHLIQPIQAKPDYAKHYATESVVTFWRYGKQCRYLQRPLMRYFDVTGREAPCCFIKDMSAFESASILRNALAAGNVPAACVGCREIATSPI